jgi:hypothetical protein
MTADSRDAESGAWQPIETAPKDGNFRLYGLNCKTGSAGTGALAQHEWFEVHYLALVDGDLILPSGDVFTDWHYDDLEFWAPAPRFSK